MKQPDKNPNTALFRIDVIKVPLAAPQDAKVVSSPRVFIDPRTGALNGLNNGGTHGKDGPEKPTDSDQCHDITVFSKIGLAAGACSGNGIVLDIKDPVHPKRLDAVNDPNYSYWHSASFSNDGKKIVFTDEWGGGTGARCRANDPNKWGANAVFRLKNNKLSFASYYKLPAAQGDTENCVAHNGSLIPVPGRDIEVQAWYQGGISVMDFTDADHPVEIAYFDRGPIDPRMLMMGGHWSSYWYNGHIYASEIARGLDIFELSPTEFLTQNEIDAAKTVRVAELNVQNQQKIDVAGSVGSSQGVSGSVGAIAGSASGPNRCRAECDSKRREFTSESTRSRKTPELHAVAERKRRYDQERSRLEAIAGPGGDPTATLKVRRGRGCRARVIHVVVRSFGACV